MRKCFSSSREYKAFNEIEIEIIKMRHTKVSERIKYVERDQIAPRPFVIPKHWSFGKMLTEGKMVTRPYASLYLTYEKIDES